MPWAFAKTVCGGSVLLIEYEKDNCKFPYLKIKKSIDLTAIVIATSSKKQPAHSIIGHDAHINLAYLKPLKCTNDNNYENTDYVKEISEKLKVIFEKGLVALENLANDAGKAKEALNKLADDAGKAKEALDNLKTALDNPPKDHKTALEKLANDAGNANEALKNLANDAGNANEALDNPPKDHKTALDNLAKKAKKALDNLAKAAIKTLAALAQINLKNLAKNAQVSLSNQGSSVFPFEYTFSTLSTLDNLVITHSYCLEVISDEKTKDSLKNELHKVWSNFEYSSALVSKISAIELF